MQVPVDDRVTQPGGSWRIVSLLALVAAGLLAIGIAVPGFTLGWPGGLTTLLHIVELAVVLTAGVLGLLRVTAPVPWLLLGAVVIDIVVRFVVGNSLQPWDTATRFGDYVEFYGTPVTLAWLGYDLSFFLLIAAMVLALVTFFRRPLGANRSSMSSGAAAGATNGGVVVGVDGTVAAGWYADPNGLPADRYWDGASWTEQTRPATARPPMVGSPGSAASIGAAPVRRNGMGTASLVMGILGLFLGWIFSLLAIIFGGVGAGRAKRGEATNRGAALWGLWLGIFGFVAWIGLGIAILAAS